MRVLLLLSFIVPFIYSCSGPQTVARDEVINVTGYDFSEYTDQGFLITPEQYLGDYQSIGLITITQWPAVREQTRRVPDSETPKGYRIVEDYFAKDINVEKAIDEIYKVANEMGADAITRFDVTPTDRLNGTLRVQGVEISGFAIKRK
ncbi:hypothetical protein G3570_07795 [Balneolaceae bacterium YR4-1]|uniref:Uncharacterized protein n=1 Tax=Halalkalibaculum roseum TaxID=2709311 RepID=A0A6M1SUA9_9BACT|nr:hypothetical protein [Halalkalibaculum roseum]NGP76530.1 hypothetical protein [Halalkalibaculum roseum]